MGFSLKDALTSAFNVGKDLFLGEGKKYGQFGDVESEDSGFLGLISKGARTYTAMQDSMALRSGKDPRDVFQMTEHKGYTAVNNYRPDQARLSTQRYTPSNRMYQDAIIRRMKQVNFDKDLQRMTESTTVRPTVRRKAPASPGTTTITRQTSAPSIRPSTATTTT